jgi:biotin carboxyl carrier protein
VRVRENVPVGLSPQELVSLTDAFEELGLDELILDVGGTRVELTSSGEPPRGDVAAPARPLLHEVLAPSVGIVRLALEPGQSVDADDVVCRLEVWTSTMPVKAGVDGTVCEVHVEEGAMVEYGQVLLSIDPAAQRVADTSSELPAAARSPSRSA